MLPAGEAYRLWAPSYDEEGPVTALENRVVGSLNPPLAGRSLLDAACGTGRRLPDTAARAVGVDLVPEMLAQARRAGRGADGLAAADVRALPITDRVFDLVWLRMAVGHLPELHVAYGELARVARRGALLIVSDFHPSAVAAGHRRTFRDSGGCLHAVEHHVHDARVHERAATASGWKLERVLDVPPGEEERHYYESAGRLAQYELERDLPLLLILCLRR